MAGDGHITLPMVPSEGVLSAAQQR